MDKLLQTPEYIFEDTFDWEAETQADQIVSTSSEEEEEEAEVLDDSVEANSMPPKEATPVGWTPQSEIQPQSPASPNSTQNSLPGFKVENILSTADLCCTPDLRRIAMFALNAEYNPKRFPAAIIRIRQPRTTALVFSSGKLVCTGAKNEIESRLAARKYARILQKLGVPVQFSCFKICSIFAKCKIDFRVRLGALAVTHHQFCTYEPEIFCGLIYRMISPRITFIIFGTGTILLMGPKLTVFEEALMKLYTVLKSFKH